MLDETIPVFDFKDVFVSEKELIDLLTIEDSKINLMMFANVIKNITDDEEYKNYTGFYIGKHILRSELEFDRLSKPGDFDIIIIPGSDKKIFYDRSCAIEVKVVRPTRKKPGKNSNSMGERQVYGLIKDGFPVAGLVHISMAEPLLEKEKAIIKYIKGGIGSGTNKVPLEHREMVDISVDVFSSSTAANQMKRLLSKDFPYFVGLTSFGINFTHDNFYRTSFDPRLLHRKASLNPSTSKQTINKLEHFLNVNPHRFLFCTKPDV